MEIEEIYVRAVELLSRLGNERLDALTRLQATLALRPQTQDYERIFVPACIERVRAHYETLWMMPTPPSPKAGQTQLKVSLAESSEFAAQTPRARAFPGAYAQIAAQLLPGVFWLAWRFTEPHQTLGTAYDGLVALDDRFVWLPKPWRVLPRTQPETAGLWSD